MWDWNDRVLCKMTPRLLTCAEAKTEELSVVREKLSTLERVDLVLMRRTSVLSLFNFRKFKEKQDLFVDTVNKGGN